MGISVELGKIPIYSTSGNLCVSTHCPVPKGAFSVAFEQLLPRLTPPVSHNRQTQQYRRCLVTNIVQVCQVANKRAVLCREGTP